MADSWHILKGSFWFYYTGNYADKHSTSYGLLNQD